MGRADDIKTSFDKDTGEHVLTVVKDDGLHRHLRCRRPDSGVYGFEIVTWPGYLAYVGDMGSYVFSRLPDMFDFFGSDGINPYYWAEKLQAAWDDKGREFSSDVYAERVREWAEEAIEDLDEEQHATVREAVDDDLLHGLDCLTEAEAHERLSEFESCGTKPSDTWEWDFRRYTHHYIWALYAITWAIREYRRLSTATQEAS